MFNFPRRQPTIELEAFRSTLSIAETAREDIQRTFARCLERKRELTDQRAAIDLELVELEGVILALEPATMAVNLTELIND